MQVIRNVGLKELGGSPRGIFLSKIPQRKNRTILSGASSIRDRVSIIIIHR